MSTAKAERLILERLAGLGTALVAHHLQLPTPPAWADAVADNGDTIALVGKHALGTSDAARDWLALVEADLRRGDHPEHVVVQRYGRRASEAWATVFASRAADAVQRTLEVCLDGHRMSGKTYLITNELQWLGEHRRRAGYRDPLKVMWVQDSLKNATEKTAASLEEDAQGGVWSLREDKQLAVCTVGGVELVHIRFVGALDASAAERLRAAHHILVLEEAIPTIDTTGVSQRQYETALSSLLRLKTPRRVAIVLTNPGAPDSWVFKRFLAPDHRPECVRVQIPAEDRLNDVQLAALHDAFRNSPDLQARLARGEWTDLILGPQVAKGFDPMVHVAKQPIEIFEGLDLWLGWDSGASHCHAVTVGQRNGGRRNVLAALVREDCGLKQFLELDVVPWFRKFAAWALTGDGRWFIHRYDPSMNGFDGGDMELNPLRRIKLALGGGQFAEGPTKWEDREGPMLALLADGDGRGGPALQISPVPETRLLISSLTSRWYYGTTKGGQVVKDNGPYKPNRPWEDLGDSFAYWCGGVAPTVRHRPRDRGKTKTVFSETSREFLGFRR